MADRSEETMDLVAIEVWRLKFQPPRVILGLVLTYVNTHWQEQSRIWEATLTVSLFMRRKIMSGYFFA
jgi:hypothetical protein